MTATTDAPVYDATFRPTTDAAPDYDAMPPTPITRLERPADPEPVAHPEPNAFVAIAPLSLEDRLRARRLAKVYPTVALADGVEVQYKRLDISQLVAMGLAPDAITVAVDKAIEASDRGETKIAISLANIDQLVIRHLGLQKYASASEDMNRAMCIGGGVRIRFAGDAAWTEMTPAIVDLLEPEDIDTLSSAIVGAMDDAVKSPGAAADPAVPVGAVRAGDDGELPAERPAEAGS